MENSKLGSEKGPRIDKWLWATRIFKTRTLAAEACRGGHVKIEGQRIKPSYLVQIGDKYEVERAHRRLDIEVKAFLDKRVSASLVDTYLIDHTPPEPPKTEKLELEYPLLKRPRGSGRPTKKERREIDSFLG
ncbi:MAG: RNA-binding S4 domain-containing protein [Verrucomicrobiota bacterium]